MEENQDLESTHNTFPEGGNDSITRVTGMYKDWFLDYASYVILERAVPAIEDGFKPVQRRIMHALKELDDGRYNKVANIVGHSMQYHPHGDASIADAMVQMGQKELLIDTQGNWGNILTGDGAAAPRYIEARLSAFALEVVFSPKITEWQLSYDGRKKEPVNLPVKFPMLLTQGAEGIAVGLSTRVLPHNFIEIIDAAVKHLKGRKFELVPDFPTAGIIDVTNYNDGLRGGRIRARARIAQKEKNVLAINEIPYGTNTASLIDSILKANEKGKIRIRKIEDNTAATVEILIHLPPGISPDKTIDALYAFTSCENSIAPLACVIENNKPCFIGISEMLKRSVEHTVSLLKAELEIRLQELHEQWHFASLERIFIENRIYRDIETQETWKGVISTIDKGLKPFTTHLKRKVTRDDVVRLTEIRIKRISKFDIDKARQDIESIEEKIKEIEYNLNHLVDYAIDYFTSLKKKYGKGRERKTEIRVFDDIVATKVVIRNTKLYVNREEGFVGTALKKDEYVCDCSDIDDIVVFTREGKMMVTRVESKTFIGKNIIHVAVFKKNDKRTVYNMLYKDGRGGPTYVKRFLSGGVTRDRSYDLTQGKKFTEILYFTANPNGEAEIITIMLRKTGGIKKLKWDMDLADVMIKGRGSRGNIVTKYAVKRIELKQKGFSTLQARKIWFDPVVKRLNTDERGDLLGDFSGEDRLLIINSKGMVKTVIPEMSLRFPEALLVLEKWNPKKPISAVYFNGDRQKFYVKRFLVENENKEELFITSATGSFLQLVATNWRPVAKIIFTKPRGKETPAPITVNFEDFIGVKNIRAIGNQLNDLKIKSSDLLEPLPYEEPEPLEANEIEVVDIENVKPTEASASKSSTKKGGKGVQLRLNLNEEHSED